MIEVIKPGLFTTVQDGGRWGYQQYGVGISGAMDAFALSCANLLVGNPEGAAGLEITVLGPTLRFTRETLLAVTGADLNPRLEGEPLETWTCHQVQPSSTLSFVERKGGVRAYLGVSGGIDVPLVMGSRSTYLLGHFGGLGGRALKAKDNLPLFPLGPGTYHPMGTFFPANLRPAYQKKPILRVILGPFKDFFSEEGVRAFLSTEYTVSPHSDRMGYRLKGEPIKRHKAGEMITCGLANGTIQVPPDGQPIILLADRQTIGGYPIIATLIHADLPLIAQCMPGDRVRFSAVSPDEAREAYLQLWSNLRTFFTADNAKKGCSV